MRGQSLHRLASSPSAFLMGCSSGRLRPRGDYEPVGIPWHYITAGRPCWWGISGTSRTKTSGSCCDDCAPPLGGGTPRWKRGWHERSRGALEACGCTWGGGERDPAVGSLASDSSAWFSIPDLGDCASAAVAESRDACKLKYMIGAAPVCYGLQPCVIGPLTRLMLIQEIRDKLMYLMYSCSYCFGTIHTHVVTAGPHVLPPSYLWYL